MSTENIAGIQVDVSKAVGSEIAKIALAQISQEELERIARVTLNFIQKSENTYYGREKSDLDKMVASMFLDDLRDKVKAIMESEEHKKQTQDMAQGVVDEIVSETKRKLIEQVSSRLSGCIVDPGVTTSMAASSLSQIFDIVRNTMMR
jgi:hypothetical protein